MSITNSIFDKLFNTRHRLYVDHELDLRQAFHHSTSFIYRSRTRSSTSFSTLDIVYMSMNELKPTSHLCCTRQTGGFFLPAFILDFLYPSLRADFHRRHRRGRLPTPRRAGLRPPLVIVVFLYQSGTFRELALITYSNNFWTSPFPNVLFIWIRFH